MKVYDISVPIGRDIHIFPGDPRFRSRQYRSLENGDLFNTQKISLGNHMGTHVDAPSHFIKGGATVTDLSLEVMHGRARVVEIHHPEKIDVPELQKLVLMDDFRILFKTRNSHIWSTHKHFTRKYIYLTGEGAKFLAENGIKLVGIDYLSIDRYGDDTFPAHKALLENGIIIVEGLNLVEVEEGNYDISCSPLALTGMDAAPARVILTK